LPGRARDRHVEIKPTRRDPRRRCPNAQLTTNQSP
jgi:hypothetical protein